MINILLIGFGKMGSALVRGWIKNNDCFKISIVEKNTKLFFKNKNNKLEFYKDLDDFISKKKQIDFVILAVKPQQIEELKNKLQRFNFRKVIFI